MNTNMQNDFSPRFVDLHRSTGSQLTDVKVAIGFRKQICISRACTVQFRSIRRSRVTGLPDVPKYGHCHGVTKRPDDRSENVTSLIVAILA